MSNLVVITFDNAEEAGKVREAIRQQEKGGRIKLDDSAVVVKDEQGKVHVKDQLDLNTPMNFISTADIIGGNSGSPLLSDRGELLGINFDRCWEGTMSDIVYDPAMCRNISIDIRYCLFIIDKFAGAGHLIDEMTIIE